jgi:hypothetical protein
MDTTGNELLPEDLEGLVLRQFDNLVSKGLVYFEPSEPEHLSHNGFQVCQQRPPMALDDVVGLLYALPEDLSSRDNPDRAASLNSESCHFWTRSQYHHQALQTERPQAGLS